VAFKLDLRLGLSILDAASVDVMPAIREGSYLRVPERSTDRWVEVDLEPLRRTLATQRRAWSNFDEIVKMIKVWAHHQGLRIPQIAVEVLVLEYLPRPASSESMLSSDAVAGFFEAASSARITHLTDPAGPYGEIAPDLNYAALRAALSKSAALARRAIDAERAWPKRNYPQDVVTHPSVFWQEIFGQDEFRRPRGWYWNLESPDEKPSPQSRRWFDEQAGPPNIQPEDSAGSGGPQDGNQGSDGFEPDDLDGRASVTDEIAETDDRPSLGEVPDAAEVLDPSIVDRLAAGDGEAAAVLARRGESQWVELKERLPRDSELAKDLAALGNSGGGVLIVGVADDGEVTGWRPADADIAVRRMREIASNILPDLAHIGHGPADNGWLAWAIVESADEPVVTAQGAYWRRTAGRVQRVELPSRGLIVRDPSASYVSLPEEGPIRVFVAMSFREEEEPALVDYWQAMLRAAERARREFKLIRLDEVEGDYDIVDRIYKEIDAAHIVIADLTLSPPNVYLEIGYARGREKQVIQTCRYDTRLEFDVRGRRTLTYRNATTLEHKLWRELDAL
jgi:Putative DNA-binding domain